MMRTLNSAGVGFFLGLSQTYDNPLYQPIFWAATISHISVTLDNTIDLNKGKIPVSTLLICSLANLIGLALGRIAGAGIELSYNNETLINVRGLIR